MVTRVTVAGLGLSLSAPASAQPVLDTEPSAATLPAKDGYDLWLRYRQVEDTGQPKRYRAALESLVWQGGGPLQRSAWTSWGSAFGWVGDRPAATDTGLFDVVRRDYVRNGAPTVLRLKLPAGRCTAHLLTGDPNTFNRPLIARVDGAETARSEQLDGREFTWLRIPLDGGSSGREVDLELSSEEDRTWHLSACVVLAEDIPF